MAHYFVPIERKALPADDHQRWTILVFDCVSPQDAITCALAFVDSLPTRGWVIWAAVRDCPTFEHMQSLRDGMSRSRYAGRAQAGKAPVSGYV